MAEQKFIVLTDSPVASREDWLGRRESAKQIADLITFSQVNSPFTIGIDGTWGTGKSTLMLMVQEALDSRGITTVWFNAWMHQHKANPAEGLVKTILLSLKGRYYLYLIFARRIGVSLLRLAFHAGLGWLKVSDSVVNEIWANFEKDIDLANMFRDRLGKAIKKLTKSKGLAVVFIDDLDRCNADAIIRLFEAVKVYLDVPGLVFVLGYDRGALVNSVKSTLISEHARMAVDYLEKIVQIPYPVPAPTDPQIEHYLSSCLKGSNTESVFTSEVAPIIIQGSQQNPRRMKRLVNSFALAHSLGFFTGDIDFKARMWLLWIYYRQLHDVFAGDLDEILRYIDYSEIRLALIRQDVTTLSDDLLQKLQGFVQYDQIPSRGEVLQQLDESVPWPFKDSYQDNNLRSLIGSLADRYRGRKPDEREELDKQIKEQADVMEKEPQLFESSVEEVDAIGFATRIGPNIEKELKEIPASGREAIWGILRKLEVNPRPAESEKISGTDMDLRSIIAENYKVVYQIDDVRRRITVITIARSPGY